MRIKQLIKTGDGLLRILSFHDDEALVIDCISRRMPFWQSLNSITDFIACEEECLEKLTGMVLPDLEAVEKKRRSAAYQRYSMIAGILPFIGDDSMRNREINEAAEQNGVSIPTIRKYLCLYLAFQSIAALVPKERGNYEKPLTNEEKAFRWAVNKFYYSPHKNSLRESYDFMIKERYCDNKGRVLQEHPSFNQFRYFYSKYKKLQSVYISRDGMKKYKRDYRPLLGDRIRDFANHAGIGEIDGTICDIHLVDDYGNYIGRPILTILVDSFSAGFVLGYSLTLEGGTYAVRNLLLNCLTNKADWCRNFGIMITEESWSICGCLPGTIVSDCGKEYISKTLSQLTELGVTLVNLPPLRPELKSIVERSFQLVQKSMRPMLKDYGYVEKDFGKRLSKDTRKEAILTLRDYEKCIIYAILYHNNSRVLKEYPFTDEMISDSVRPHPRDIFEWGRKQDGADFIPIAKEELILTLMPRVKARFTRKGLVVLGLRYACEGNHFTEEYLSGGDAIAAFNPDSVDEVYLLWKGKYVLFRLIESRFSGMSFKEAAKKTGMQRAVIRQNETQDLQGRINLQTNIEAVIAEMRCFKEKTGTELCLKQVRDSRNREKEKYHRNSQEEAKDE